MWEVGDGLQLRFKLLCRSLAAISGWTPISRGRVQPPELLILKPITIFTSAVRLCAMWPLFDLLPFPRSTSKAFTMVREKSNSCGRSLGTSYVWIRLDKPKASEKRSRKTNADIPVRENTREAAAFCTISLITKFTFRSKLFPS